MSFNVGENVGAYRIVEQLGQGGMATVYKAYHAALDRYVAIKVMHAAFKAEANFLARFQREARVVAKLEHPNIVPVYDYAEHNGSPYLVMKFIEGETLKARLTRGPLSAGETSRIFEAVGAGLDYAHRQGILHRDIKPSNVMLAQDGSIYLADFGLARIAQAGESTLSTDSMLGTPQYMSPEQAKGVKNLDAGTDIYSLGVMMYELMVGRVPYSADTPFAIIHDHIFTPLPMPRTVNPNVPEAMERVLLKSLAKERADRYADVATQVTAFLAVLAPQVAAAPTLATPGPGPTLAGPAGGATILAPQAAAGATVVVPKEAEAGATVVAPAGAVKAAAPAAPAAGRKSSPWLWVGVGGVGLIVIVGLLLVGLLVRAGAQRRNATATARAQNTAAAVAQAAAQTAAAQAPPTPPPAKPTAPPADKPTEPKLPPGVFYFNNFDDGNTAGWKLDPGWGVRDGALCGKGHQWASYVQGAWRDYRQAFRLRLDRGQIHVNFRVRPEPPPLTRYFVEFGPDHVLLSKQEGEMFANGIQVKPMKFNPGEWYYVEVLGQGPRVMVTVNKETALDFPDGKPLLEGGISFETLEQSAVCVDDVEVNELTSPLPPPAEMPGAPAGGGDPMAMIREASKLLDAKEIDKGLAVLDEAVALEAQNPKVLLAAGDAALSHGARFAQRALMRFYLPGLQLAREQKMEVVGRLSAQTTLAMYAMAQDPDGEKVFNELIQVMQPPDWPAAGKIRWQVFSPGADLGALEKELADLTAKFSDNQALYLVRGDLNVRQKRLVRAGQDYNTVMKNWTKDTPGWVLAEAQCKFKAIQENRLNANLEITCVDLSSLVTGK